MSGSGDLPPGGDVVVAGGMESMTRGARTWLPAPAPATATATPRWSTQPHDALFCSVDMRGMGAATDFYNKAKDIGRAEQDEYAAMSHDRAATAAKNALLDDEIVAVEVLQRRGDPLQVSQDDGVRSATTAESLGKLRPAFAPDGTVTAGSASRTSELAKRALRKAARS